MNGKKPSEAQTNGFFLKYFVKINEKLIGKFLIYFLAPIVIFHGTLHTTLISNVIFLPILIFLISSFDLPDNIEFK